MQRRAQFGVLRRGNARVKPLRGASALTPRFSA
jgi:hypothetical protein